MSEDGRVRCQVCAGIKQGAITSDDVVCGSSVPDVPEASGLKKTECQLPRRGVKKDAEGLYVVKTDWFKARVAALLRRVECFGVGRERDVLG
jgi:hypothetical protein